MRIILVCLIWILCVGGLHTFLQRKATAHATTLGASPIHASRRYSLEIQTTGVMSPDPFTATNDEGASLAVFLSGDAVYRNSKPIAAGDVLRIKEVPGLLAGENELYVSGNCGTDGNACALRIRLLLEETVLDDVTLWADKSGRVQGSLVFVISEPGRGGSHGN